MDYFDSVFHRGVVGGIYLAREGKHVCPVYDVRFRRHYTGLIFGKFRVPHLLIKPTTKSWYVEGLRSFFEYVLYCRYYVGSVLKGFWCEHMNVRKLHHAKNLHRFDLRGPVVEGLW